MSFTNQQTITEVKLYNLLEKLTDRSTAKFLAECLEPTMTMEEVYDRQAMFKKLEDKDVYEKLQEAYEDGDLDKIQFAQKELDNTIKKMAKLTNMRFSWVICL